ncbi:MAG: phytanoyl-CoA dioxygenase family protein [Fibrella sp.]|nr:phytanoyl-CoA dioxygenase family protein [Armatimonadota bacterium]
MAVIEQSESVEARRARYWETGYLVLSGLFAPEETEAWRAESERLLRSDVVQPNNVRTPFRKNSGEFPERIDPVLDISPLFDALARDARIMDVLHSLFGDTPVVFKDKLIYKLPGTEGYVIHQDQAYWQFCPPDDILSVSIALDAANEANGAVALYPGYHHELLTPVGAKRGIQSEELTRIDTGRRDLIATRPGDVLIFHSLTPHDSAPNTSPHPRRSLYLTYNAKRAGDLQAQQLEDYVQRNSSGNSYFK